MKVYAGLIRDDGEDCLIVSTIGWDDLAIKINKWIETASVDGDKNFLPHTGIDDILPEIIKDGYWPIDNDEEMTITFHETEI